MQLKGSEIQLYFDADFFNSPPPQHSLCTAVFTHFWNACNSNFRKKHYNKQINKPQFLCKRSKPNLLGENISNCNILNRRIQSQNSTLSIERVGEKQKINGGGGRQKWQKEKKRAATVIYVGMKSVGSEMRRRKRRRGLVGTFAGQVSETTNNKQQIE